LGKQAFGTVVKPYLFGENAYVVLDGELDIFRRVEIASALPDPADVKTAVINLARATYIDSMVLGMLVGFRRAFVDAGGAVGNLVLMLPKEGPIRRTFEISGLTRLFPTAYVEPTDVDELVTNRVIEDVVSTASTTAVI
jgi:anti-anti-sigma factor